MDKEDFAAIGKYLYGKYWQSELSKTLKINDRTIRYYKAGGYRIPQGVAGDMCLLVAQKQFNDGLPILQKIYSKNSVISDLKKQNLRLSGEAQTQIDLNLDIFLDSIKII